MQGMVKGDQTAFVVGILPKGNAARTAPLTQLVD
jgi:hypothetical protein